ncbi:MAG: LacI family DNA-binding transcriptional regulator [Planctomycetota bacterium]
MNQSRVPSRRVTQKAIASALELDQTTVSRCFTVPERVDAKTRERILAKAKELGYRPNWRGRVFRQQQTRMIGLVHTDEQITYSYGNPELLGGLIGALHDRGYQLVHVRVAEDGKSTDSLLDARFDGCFIDYFVRQVELDAIQNADLPAVLINAEAIDGFPAVAPDHTEAGRLMGRHLLELGHRQAAFFRGFRLPQTDHPGFATDAWSAGLREVFREAGAGDGLIVVRPNREIEADGQITPAFEAAMRDLKGLDQPPTALIAVNARQAVDELAWHLPGVGLEASPGAVSIVSMIDGRELERRTRPISAIRMPYHQMGQIAADLLIQRIEGRRPVQSPGFLPVELVHRRPNPGRDR